MNMFSRRALARLAVATGLALTLAGPTLAQSKSQEGMQDVKPHRHFWTVPENAKMGMKSLRLPSPPTGESNIGSPRFPSRILMCGINRCEEVAFCFL